MLRTFPSLSLMFLKSMPPDNLPEIPDGDLPPLGPDEVDLPDTDPDIEPDPDAEMDPASEPDTFTHQVIDGGAHQALTLA